MIEITTSNAILLDGKPVGLSLRQAQHGTVIYTPASVDGRVPYREHPMPRRRYSAAHDAPASGVPGRAALEADLRALIDRLRSLDTAARTSHGGAR